ncbi:formimidoylglutamate deiminase [Alloacidobacterium dinghuense]|uniref:Formimidoylglutamate deiminase n=1 Tax=Alloacidobacterium dinghuense TaxID=2763107 RepID=A0A7G8BKV2_9BACT|nr:formimidoylglutamate deiminase [Alloacidobacterium dinghuense]QNI33172.1 formimidoylglutamate deiminase [Alloacidobacterium dinghuense]
MSTSYLPEALYTRAGFASNTALSVDDRGKISAHAAEPVQTVSLPRRALLPGLINVHSHAFQRLIRGKSESRVTSGKDFWSWRGTMYHAAAQLTPQDVYDVARMTFLEMARAGITTVGEFHYLHTDPNGHPYDDPNLLSRMVIAAAQSVGIRIVLLRAAYFRSGYQVATDPGQIRFFENTTDFLANAESLLAIYPINSGNQVQLGIAPHSIRAIPLEDLRELTAWANAKQLPLHMHISEQVAENAACKAEYGTTPVTLLTREGLLTRNLTAVHAIHITDDEIRMMAEAGATICSCPTTERNLGDGSFPADRTMRAGIPIAFGSDSQAQISLIEDARELDYHLRLSHQERAVLDQIDGQPLAARLLDCATIHGARSLSVAAGELTDGKYADFFTVDLDHPSIVGNSPEDLLSIIVFGLDPSAIRDVAVNGKLIIRDGKHEFEKEIIARYKEVYRKVWAKAPAIETLA